MNEHEAIAAVVSVFKDAAKKAYHAAMAAVIDAPAEAYVSADIAASKMYDVIVKAAAAAAAAAEQVNYE